MSYRDWLSASSAYNTHHQVRPDDHIRTWVFRTQVRNPPWIPILADDGAARLDSVSSQFIDIAALHTGTNDSLIIGNRPLQPTGSSVDGDFEF
jgi:hypothetical protein